MPLHGLGEGQVISVGPTVIVFIGEAVGREDVLDAIVALGGVRDPDPYSDASVGQGSVGMWINYERGCGDDGDIPYEPEGLALVASKLDGFAGPRVVFTGTKGAGTPTAILEVIEGLAGRWRLVIDRNVPDEPADQFVTVEQLRSLARAGVPLFA